MDIEQLLVSRASEGFFDSDTGHGVKGRHGNARPPGHNLEGACRYQLLALLGGQRGWWQGCRRKARWEGREGEGGREDTFHMNLAVGPRL